ncbi:MAG TPA: uracil-DNA glycosylase [Candidatus Sulfotelmatobacter sp.]|nr:uracil-DNA glycosylase [Candidatus Sulfotelmatobacter sp.]
MPFTLDPGVRQALAERMRYYHELGIYDFYRRVADAVQSPGLQVQPEMREEMPAKKAAAGAAAVEESIFEVLISRPEQKVTDPVAALKLIREDLGDCTRCPLHKQGRKQIVFGVGNPRAELMFVGEGPGADEDAQGEPFVGRAGQLLNNMIKAMGLKREEIYIANVVKCRPPGNRTPEREECETCSPFLMRQIAAIKPKVVVALGAVAARNLLAMNAPMSELRGRFYDFMPAGARSSDPNWQGAKLAVTYHPAFLLRDPRQKGEAWKDLQMVMKYLGLKPPAKSE